MSKDKDYRLEKTVDENGAETVTVIYEKPEKKQAEKPLINPEL